MNCVFKVVVSLRETDLYGQCPLAEREDYFANVQRDWLLRLRKERGLQAAVRLAGADGVRRRGRVNG